MTRLAMFLCALLVGVALSTTGASAKSRHHHHGWHHHHHGLFGLGLFGWRHHHSPHYGWRYHAAGAPAKTGPFCWVDTDSARGIGFYKACDGARPAHRGKHRHRHHR